MTKEDRDGKKLSLGAKVRLIQNKCFSVCIVGQDVRCYSLRITGNIHIMGVTKFIFTN